MAKKSEIVALIAPPRFRFSQDDRRALAERTPPLPEEVITQIEEACHWLIVAQACANQMPSAAAVKQKIAAVLQRVSALREILEHLRDDDVGEAARVSIIMELQKAKSTLAVKPLNEVVYLEIAATQAAKNLGETRGAASKESMRKFIQRIAMVIIEAGAPIRNNRGHITSAFVTLVSEIATCIRNNWPKYDNVVCGKFDFPTERRTLAYEIREALANIR